VRRRTFIRGAALLAGSSLVSRLLGGLIRIPLARLLGGEGVGVLTTAYVLFGLAITFAVSGLCVATSRVVAERLAREDRRGADRALAASLLIALASGLGFWAVLDRGAVFAAGLILGRSEPTLVSMMSGTVRAIAPAVLPVSLMSALKGYFQGRQDMTPTSQAQVVEQVVRVSAMLWLVMSLRDQGLGPALAGAAFGNVIGATAALGLLIFTLARSSRGTSGGPAGGYRVRSGGPAERRREGPSVKLDFPPASPARRILGLAVPVAAGAAVLPLMDAMQTFIVPRRLAAAGLDPGTVVYLYGQLHFMAYPLASLPAIAATAMAAALVPAVTDALERGRLAEVRRGATTAVRLTILFSLPAAAGLAVLAGPICQMLYGIPEAGGPLTWVAAACLFISLQQTTSGVLQGLGLAATPAWGLAAGLAVDTAVTYLLTGVRSLGVNGAALGIVAGFGLAAAVNMAAIAARTGLTLDPAGMVVRPSLAAAAMIGASVGVYSWAAGTGAGNTVATLGAVAAGAVVYALALLAVGGVDRRELELIPRVGPRLSAILGPRTGRGR